MDALLAAGDRDGELPRELEDMSDEDIAAFMAAMSWSGRVATAHTITREIRDERTARLDLELARGITVPVLVVTGEHSIDASKPHAERWRLRFPTPASSSSRARPRGRRTRPCGLRESDHAVPESAG